MDLSKLPKLILNNINLKPLFIVNEGVYGLTIALTIKENPTKYPLLVCKIFKSYKKDYITLTNTTYKLLQKYNITPQLLGIQTLQNNFSFECKYNDQQSKLCEFDKNIYYYEIAGIMTLTQYLIYLFELKYDNIDYLIKYIDTIVNNITNINNDGYIHCDLYTDNIMIKNNHTYYLFYAYNTVYTTKDIKQKRQLFKYIDYYLFNDINDILSDEHLNNKKLNIKLNNNIISIIDWDLIININSFFNKKIKKYNVNNNKVKKILSLIYSVYCKYDLIMFYLYVLDIIIYHKKNLSNNNINKILKYTENKFLLLIDDIIKRNNILQKLNNKQLCYHIIINIYYSFINRKLKKSFDSIFNYLYTKQYLKEKDYIYFERNYKYIKSIDLSKYDIIKLNENDKKIIYKKNLK